MHCSVATLLVVEVEARASSTMVYTPGWPVNQARWKSSGSNDHDRSCATTRVADMLTRLQITSEKLFGEKLRIVVGGILSCPLMLSAVVFFIIQACTAQHTSCDLCDTGWVFVIGRQNDTKTKTIHGMLDLIPGAHIISTTGLESSDFASRLHDVVGSETEVWGDIDALLTHAIAHITQQYTKQYCSPPHNTTPCPLYSLSERDYGVAVSLMPWNAKSLCVQTSYPL